ncbi:hypothetical protein [Rhodopirellula sallentina]|nr:hypothetical protein [Rhodopirellula sallentina]
MSRIIKYLSVPVLAIGLVLAGEAPKADAGGFSISFGTGGYGVPGYRYSSGYSGYGYRSYRPTYGYGYSRLGPVIYPGVGLGYHSGYRGYPYHDYRVRKPGPPRHHYDHHGHRGHDRYDRDYDRRGRR